MHSTKNNQDKMQELLKLKSTISEGGGKEKIQKQHISGKYTARERIELLFDKNSFVEMDSFIKTRSSDLGTTDNQFLGDGVVTGYGTVNEKLVFISSQDFTVMGGSLGEMHAKKITKAMDAAVKMGAPFISINDSGGARIQEGIDSLSGFGEIFFRNTISSGVIPQISVIMGPCAGGAVYSPAITDFVLMTQGTSQMFITGPQVIKAVTGESVTFEELGGAATHNSASGVAHFNCPDELTCISTLKRLLSFLPDNNLSACPLYDTQDKVDRICSKLDHIIPEDSNKPYDIIEVIEEIVDNGDFFEIQQYFAPNIVIGFSRLDGSTVGIIANQPKVLAGVLDVNSSDKAARFVRFCDAFNIPILTFTDVPGYLPGVSQELTGIIRHGAKLLYAFSEATVPKVNIILRKAYGGAYIAMNSKHLGCDMVLAWPTAEIAVMGAEGAANIIHKNEINASDNPEKTRQLKIDEYQQKFLNPYIAASRGYVDNIIQPSTSRALVISAFKAFSTKGESRLQKKHGNIPL